MLCPKSRHSFSFPVLTRHLENPRLSWEQSKSYSTFPDIVTDCRYLCWHAQRFVMCDVREKIRISMQSCKQRGLTIYYCYNIHPCTLSGVVIETSARCLTIYKQIASASRWECHLDILRSSQEKEKSNSSCDIRWWSAPSACCLLDSLPIYIHGNYVSCA